MDKLTLRMLRQVKLNKGQFLAVGVVIFLGMLAYSAIKTGFENLDQSKEQYYSQYSFGDVFIELERAPKSIIARVQQVEGVQKVTGRIGFRVNLLMPDNPENVTARLVSIPTHEQRPVSGILVTEGQELKEQPGANLLVDPQFFVANHLKLGESLYPVINNKKHKLQIIGVATGPEYIYNIRSAQDMMPTPTEYGVFFISQDLAESVFAYEGAINELVLTLEPGVNTDEVKDRLEELLEPYGLKNIILRKNQSSHAIFQAEIDQLAGMAKSFPVIFLLVAATIIYIMLNRIVKTDRRQIGVLMALGYSKWTVLFHYLSYSLLIGAVGSISGLLVGFYLGTAITKYYTVYFNLPIMVLRLHWGVLGTGLFLGLAFSGAAGFFATKSVLAISPMEAMRAEPPKLGSHILLERLKWLWHRLTFAGKMISRNILRNKQRSFFVSLGIAFAVSLLVVGLFSLDAFDFIIKENFQKMQVHDLKVSLRQPINRNSVREIASTYPVQRAEGLLEYGFKFRKAWREETFPVVGVESDTTLLRIIDQEGKQLRPRENGLIIAEQIATKLQLQVGDTVDVKPVGLDSDWKKAQVTGIVKQYIGMSAYGTNDYVARLMGETELYNSVLLKVDPANYEQVTADLKDLPIATSVESRLKTVAMFEQLLASSVGATVVIFLFGGAMGFAIIYNSTAINISERMRELASLRVLGLTRAEVAGLIFKENYLLAILGILLGLPLGYSFCWAMIHGYTNEVYSLPIIIYPRTYALAALGGLVFVYLSQRLSRKKLDHIDMVEVLKNRE